ncbi:L-serine ammonia-lyase, iron-sulfur-dependent subunit beta [Mediterraneibacter massiliensis]|uniref:L-serine ammonia-lyase, iron-sulfur-dependent subunit beta n=1 Tax=Mediterraneibacter massiliensis TaxID=1720300 RepID=UPI0024AD0CDF|nr:L-serine ammonia-lyase, iron-sulfur-dependent subunit beta [Mediterraneibacter massiliensis]
MEFLSIFDVLGPNMIGPSSSHTAGAASIGRMARKMFPERIISVKFILYGSFARTYQGHGTDKALLGGILGFETDDPRIRESFRWAQEQGISYSYTADEENVPEHPNTVDIVLRGCTGKEMCVRGESIGGGKIKITRINGIHVEFTGEYSTLIVKQADKPGVAAHISQCLAARNVNIAFMRLFREKKGDIAYTVVESDEKIPESILTEMKQNPAVLEILLIQL